MSLMNPHAASAPSLAVCWLAQHHHRLRPTTNTDDAPQKIPQSRNPTRPSTPSVHVLRLAASVGEATHPNEPPSGRNPRRGRSWHRTGGVDRIALDGEAPTGLFLGLI